MENLNNTSVEEEVKTGQSSSSLVWSDYIQIALFACLLTVGGFMNLVSFVYFGFRKTRFKSNYRYFIAHLSLADLLCCLMTPVFVTMLIVNNERWVFGEITCKYVYPLARLTGNCSAWILCGMTYERYRAFTNPFKKLRKKIIQIYLVTIWLVFIFSSMAYSIYTKDIKIDQCSYSIHYKSVYLNVVKLNIKIAAPSAIIIILCARLRLFLNNNTDTKTISSISDENPDDNKLQTRRQRKRDKSEKMILYSAISYLVCVLPTYAVQMVSCVIIQMELSQSSNISTKNIRWALIMFYTNSVINVFIYAGRFKDFRKFIFETLKLFK